MSGKQMSLEATAHLTGWTTPAAHELGGTPEQHLARKRAAVARGVKMGSTAVTHLSLVAQLAGWQSLTANDAKAKAYTYDQGDATKVRPTNLGLLAGRATPTTRDHKDGASDLSNVPLNSLLGRQVSLSAAPTENRGALNPAFSLWLMGFPPEWESCAPQATRSSRRSRRGSSKR